MNSHPLSIFKFAKLSTVFSRKCMEIRRQLNYFYNHDKIQLDFFHIFFTFIDQKSILIRKMYHHFKSGNNSKSTFLLIHTLAFILYFIFFSFLFYMLRKNELIFFKHEWDYLCYGFVFSLFSLSIPLVRMILIKIIKKQYRSR